MKSPKSSNLNSNYIILSFLTVVLIVTPIIWVSKTHSDAIIKSLSTKVSNEETLNAVIMRELKEANELLDAMIEDLK